MSIPRSRQKASFPRKELASCGATSGCDARSSCWLCSKFDLGIHKRRSNMDSYGFKKTFLFILFSALREWWDSTPKTTDKGKRSTRRYFFVKIPSDREERITIFHVALDLQFNQGRMYPTQAHWLTLLFLFFSFLHNFTHSCVQAGLNCSLGIPNCAFVV